MNGKHRKSGSRLLGKAWKPGHKVHLPNEHVHPGFYGKEYVIGNLSGQCYFVVLILPE